MTTLEDLENAVAFLESKLVPYSKLEETWRAIGQMARAFVEYEKEKLEHKHDWKNVANLLMGSPGDYASVWECLECGKLKILVPK